MKFLNLLASRNENEISGLIITALALAALWWGWGWEAALIGGVAAFGVLMVCVGIDAREREEISAHE